MGNLIDKEPKYNEGWGFCSSDPRTKNCNEVIDISATDSRGTNIVRDQARIYYIVISHYSIVSWNLLRKL